MTAQEVFRLAPGLKEQLDRRIGAPGNRDAAYLACRGIAAEFVGWRAKNEALQGPQAYEAVLRYICQKLDC